METAIVYWSSIGKMEQKIVEYWDNGKENGNYYINLGQNSINRVFLESRDVVERAPRRTRRR